MTDVGDLRVISIRWVGGTTAGHQVVIVDTLAAASTANKLWESVATATNFTDDQNNARRRWPKGFRVATIASGTLYVTFE